MKKLDDILGFIADSIMYIIIAGGLIVLWVWCDYTYHKSIVRDAIEESRNH